MDISQMDIDQNRVSVTNERIEKTDRYFHQKDKKLSIGVELLLNHTLSQIGIFNPVFRRDEYGKPFLKNHSDIHFNLSHSENYVACAVSDSPVGVDIEHIQDVDLNIAKHYFFGSEYEHILSSNDKKRTFFELWVLKESFMKMTGRGFRLALDEFSVEIGDRIRVLHEEDDPEFGVWNVAEGEYMLAVCSKSRVSEPELINLQDIENEIESRKGESRESESREGESREGEIQYREGEILCRKNVKYQRRS
jgi:4'-phosphopantetheinyl transferase